MAAARHFRFLALGATACALLSSSAFAAPAARWVSSWGASMQRAAPPATPLAGRTLRQSVTVSAGGSQVRVRLSNELGAERLAIGAATLALQPASGPAVVRKLTFSGAASALIPPGAPLISDPVSLPVADMQALTVSLYLPGPVQPGGLDRQPAPTAILTAPGDFTAQPDAAGEPAPNYFLASVEVLPKKPARGLVLFGDTKSAGKGTWPDFITQALARRGVAVSNRSAFAGGLVVGGPADNGAARFDRDVLASAGATDVLLFTGNNDIIQPGMVGSGGKVMVDPALALSYEQLIAVYDQLSLRARTQGLRVIGGTLTPYEGVTIQGYATPEKLALRDRINAWIRTSKAFDAVIDFDAAVRDPANPQRLLPAYDSGNHFTPNEAGYRAMAEKAAAVLMQ